jgi:hypothetical protein
VFAFIALLLALVAPAPAPSPSYPPIVMPADWTLQPSTAKPGNLLGEWRRTPRPEEKYPTRLLYYAFPNASYADAVAKWRQIVSCPAHDDGFMAYIHVCGFAIDQDEQCKGHPAHRFVRNPTNLGPPELVAVTYLYVPYHDGYLEMEYYRPSTEFAPGRGGEREDDVLAAMRTWCETASAQ